MAYHHYPWQTEEHGAHNLNVYVLSTLMFQLELSAVCVSTISAELKWWDRSGRSTNIRELMQHRLTHVIMIIHIEYGAYFYFGVMSAQNAE